MRIDEGSKHWLEAAAWSGGGIRREVFFFESGGVDLYGSLYAATELSRPYGLLACGSWGVEGTRTEPLRRSAALAMARLGGAAMVFHWPGHGDSLGDPAGLALADFAAAAADAVAAAERRVPDLEWIFAGFMFGAAAACIALRERGGGRLLLSLIHI